MARSLGVQEKLGPRKLEEPSWRKKHQNKRPQRLSKQYSICIITSGTGKIKS
jgi:hypothetical protein